MADSCHFGGKIAFKNLLIFEKEAWKLVTSKIKLLGAGAGAGGNFQNFSKFGGC